ncbi:transporter substrate-binding domain-containing protein [Candidatus Phytoplasma melaleucae]|uniref:Transporter substrate-binding domain-containing protein n=1 Tax=Candidatus Phytoplasma melaleucae TaxID=2982630 RepID=A0ABT9DEE5_9MOLU|nr:transporter substrate-binding domain-containing protein ['Melaleuca sp.' phytoplasma]MDO8168154.1 transporter substrate-binding domain-containing protein ['Melaleuca sp.' phytoplasma]
MSIKKIKKYLKNWQKLSIIFFLLAIFIYLNFNIFMIFFNKNKSSNTITLGIVNNCPPLAFDAYNAPNSIKTENDESISGFDLLLFQDLAKRIGKNLIIKLYSFPVGVLNAVQNGSIDAAIGNMNITPEREKKMLAIKYGFSDVGILLRRDDKRFQEHLNSNSIPIETLNKIITQSQEKIKLNTMTQTIYDIEILDKLQKENHLSNYEKSNFKEDAVNCAYEIENKSADVFIFDFPVLNILELTPGNEKKFKSLKITHIDKEFQLPLGIFVAKENKKLANSLQKAIESISSSDKEKYYQKAFTDYNYIQTKIRNKISFMQKLTKIVQTYKNSFFVSLTLAIDSLLLGFMLALILVHIKIFCSNVSEKKFLLLSQKILLIITTFCSNFAQAVPIAIQALLLYNILIKQIDLLKEPVGPFFISLFIILFNNAFNFMNIILHHIRFLDQGPIEAAYALGMNQKQVFKHIILEQALKRTSPSIWNQFIVNLKDTALFSIIGLTSLLWSAQRNIAITYDTITPFVIVSIIYLILVSITNIISHKIHKQ